MNLPDYFDHLTVVGEGKAAFVPSRIGHGNHQCRIIVGDAGFGVVFPP